MLQHAAAGIATLIRSDHCCAIALVTGAAEQCMLANFSAYQLQLLVLQQVLHVQ